MKFDEAKHEYTTDEGLIVPSVTGVIKECRIASYDRIAADILENRRALGAHVHKCTHYHDEGALDLRSVHHEAMSYLKAWVRFKIEGLVTFDTMEAHQIGKVAGMPYGMTPDRSGKLEGRRTVLDIKISRQREEWWGVQTAAYAIGICDGDVELAKLMHRTVVQLRDDQSYRLWDYADPLDFDVFQWALALVWWKRNKGIVTEYPQQEEVAV